MRMVEVRILPPQPFSVESKSSEARLSLCRRQSGGNPALPAAVHGFHVGVAHFLKIFRGERGTEAAAAVQNEFRLGIRHRLFDVALDDAFSQVNRPGYVSVGPLAVLASIYENEFLSRIEAALHVGHIGLFDVLLRLIDQLQKLRRVSHERTPWRRFFRASIPRVYKPSTRPEVISRLVV